MRETDRTSPAATADSWSRRHDHLLTPAPHMPMPSRTIALLVAIGLLSAGQAISQSPLVRGDVVRLHRLTAHGDTESVVARWHFAARDSVVVAPGRADSAG